MSLIGNSFTNTIHWILTSLENLKIRTWHRVQCRVHDVIKERLVTHVGHVYSYPSFHCCLTVRTFQLRFYSSIFISGLRKKMWPNVLMSLAIYMPILYSVTSVVLNVNKVSLFLYKINHDGIIKKVFIVYYYALIWYENHAFCVLVLGIISGNVFPINATRATRWSAID